MKPEVSIITPLYNAEKYIKETVESVLSQTFKDFEWLIVDDCSTDSSRKILKKIAAEDQRIKLLDLKSNKGPIFARNYALDQAQGRFIAFLDSDDIWLPAKLEKQIALMKEKKAPLSFTAYKKIAQDGTIKTGITIQVPEKLTYNHLLGSNCIMASSAMYDTSITGAIKQFCDIPLGKDDYYFFLFIIKNHGCAYGLKEDLARLRVHNDSVTGDKFKAAKVQWYFYRTCIGLSILSSLHKFTVYSVKGFLKYIL
ncbi:MAG: glycosyltransferase family 2 protein [Spirochaetales bacterium]|nr:glycosyltransferase family 2 protein [Spirochaetales bacterium]